MTLKQQDFRFSHRPRVRWAVVDMQKINEAGIAHIAMVRPLS